MGQHRAGWKKAQHWPRQGQTNLTELLAALEMKKGEAGRRPVEGRNIFWGLGD